MFADLVNVVIVTEQIVAKLVLGRGDVYSVAQQLDACYLLDCSQQLVVEHDVAELADVRCFVARQITCLLLIFTYLALVFLNYFNSFFVHFNVDYFWIYILTWLNLYKSLFFCKYFSLVLSSLFKSLMKLVSSSTSDITQCVNGWWNRLMPMYISFWKFDQMWRISMFFSFTIRIIYTDRLVDRC